MIAFTMIWLQGHPKTTLLTALTHLAITIRQIAGGRQKKNRHETSAFYVKAIARIAESKQMDQRHLKVAETDCARLATNTRGEMGS